ncbi:hypothetical protein GCM10009789_08850 [Kribbella sancticallisti]|uniref:DUF6318 domain-containing protein n=1 Tax=Kribbella sancticallisti TaxID=460087 RepID=A0ABN2CJU8_9ACTN
MSRRRFRTTTAFTAAVVLAFTTSCTDNPEPPGGPATSPPSSSTLPPSPPTPSVAPAPTPPAAAAGITVTSADAFARFYLTAIDHAAATGDVTTLRTWSDKGCISCNKLIKHYTDVYGAGGSVTGNFRSTNAKTTSARLKDTKAADITLQFTEGRHTIVPSKGAKPTVFPGGQSQWQMALMNQSGHWVMYEMRDQ